MKMYEQLHRLRHVSSIFLSEETEGAGYTYFTTKQKDDYKLISIKSKFAQQTTRTL